MQLGVASTPPMSKQIIRIHAFGQLNGIIEFLNVLNSVHAWIMKRIGMEQLHFLRMKQDQSMIIN